MINKNPESIIIPKKDVKKSLWTIKELPIENEDPSDEDEDEEE